MIISGFIVYLIGIGSGALGIILGIIGAAVGYISAEFLPSWWILNPLVWRIFMTCIGYFIGTLIAFLLLWAIHSRSS